MTKKDEKHEQLMEMRECTRPYLGQYVHGSGLDLTPRRQVTVADLEGL